MDKAALHIDAVTFIHRFGSSLNEQVHFGYGVTSPVMSFSLRRNFVVICTWSMACLRNWRAGARPTPMCLRPAVSPPSVSDGITAQVKGVLMPPTRARPTHMRLNVLSVKTGQSEDNIRLAQQTQILAWRFGNPQEYGAICAFLSSVYS